MPTLAAPPPRGAPLFHQPVQISQPNAPVTAAHRFSQPWSGWFRNMYNVMKPGKTEDVVVGGVTLHFINGVYAGHD